MVVDAPEPWWVPPLMIVVTAIALTLFIWFDKEIGDFVVWTLVHILVLLRSLI